MTDDGALWKANVEERSVRENEWLCPHVRLLSNDQIRVEFDGKVVECSAPFTDAEVCDVQFDVVESDKGEESLHLTIGADRLVFDGQTIFSFVIN